MQLKKIRDIKKLNIPDMLILNQIIVLEMSL
jgi:hypothetical protein